MLWADSREQDFVLDWLLPGWGGNSVTEYLKDSYREEGRTEQGSNHDWWRNSSHSNDPGKVVVFISSVVQTMFMFCLCSDMIIRGPWFCLEPSLWIIRVASWDVYILWNCWCSREEHQGLTVDAWPALLFLGHEAWAAQWGEPGGHRKGREGAKDKRPFLTLAASAEVSLWGLNGVVKLCQHDTKTTSDKKREETSGSVSVKPHSNSFCIADWLFCNLIDSKSDTWV